MTTEQARQESKSFIDKCDQDGDPYLIVHFSHENDFFQGCHERMDFADALLVIDELVKYFKINKQLL